MRHNSDEKNLNRNPLGSGSIIDTIGLKSSRAKLLFSVQPEKGMEIQKFWGAEVLKVTVAEVRGDLVALLWSNTLQYTVHKFSVP